MEKGSRDQGDQFPSPSSSETSKRSRVQNHTPVDKKMEESVGEKKNPLDIPEIVAIVTSYITEVGDLKSVRTLNTMWNQETFKKWRNSAIFLINDETVPVLVKAFKDDLPSGASEREKELERASPKDPFQLKEFPFKKYRIFTQRRAWTYPLGEDGNEREKILIWEKCIGPNAIYLDVGECILPPYYTPVDMYGRHNSTNVPGLEWIMAHSSNVTDLALAPLNGKRNTRQGRLYEGTTYKALQLRSLTISNSHSGMEMLPPFFEQIRNYCARNLFRMIPNLKILTLPGGYGALNLMYEISVATTRRGAEIQTPLHLESLNALELRQQRGEFGDMIFRYLKNCEESPTLRELRVPALQRDVVGENGWLSETLRVVQGTLTKLELVVDCDKDRALVAVLGKSGLFLKGCFFPNLTHFKVLLNYKAFNKRLLTFKFKHLRKMPQLREFYFGTKTRTEKDWATRKVTFPQRIIQQTAAEEDGDFQLPHLKLFHFHGNFKKEAIQQLGRITKNLKCLELIFDQENFSAVNDTWPALMNLKILPCSDVSAEALSGLQESNASLNIVDDSKNWIPAITIFPYED